MEVWKTVVLGAFGTMSEYRRELHWKKRCVVEGRVDKIFGRPWFACVEQKMEVDLVAPSIRELGLSSGAEYSQACARGLERGWALCPPELGFALRLCYDDQPKRECLYIAMEPKVHSHTQRFILMLDRVGDDCWLGASQGLPREVDEENERLVFLKPRW